MSIDRSLKTSGELGKHRNVLTRAERIEKLAAKGEFDMETSNPLGLVKVANRKVAARGKAKKKGPAAEGEEGAEGAVAEGAAPSA